MGMNEGYHTAGQALHPPEYLLRKHSDFRGRREPQVRRGIKPYDNRRRLGHVQTTFARDTRLLG